MRDLIIFINGIHTSPGNAFAWTDNAVRFVNRRAGERFLSDKFEYHTTALFRRLTLSKHADDLARTLSDYVAGNSDLRLHLVGHSNGCELIARAVRLSGVPVASVHLISGAVERDFGRNGLGERLARGQVGAAFCYCSRGDFVLRYMARPSQIFRLVGLGYGDLGYRGPSGVADGLRVETHWEQSLGHGDWFKAGQFDATLERVLANASRSIPSA